MFKYTIRKGTQDDLEAICHLQSYAQEKAFSERFQVLWFIMNCGKNALMISTMIIFSTLPARSPPFWALSIADWWSIVIER